MWLDFGAVRARVRTGPSGGRASRRGEAPPFMLVRTLMNHDDGRARLGVRRLDGAELALEWGVIAFVLNYIPVIGPLIATVFPTLYAMAQSASWQMALSSSRA